jgi:hypothetical protein
VAEDRPNASSAVDAAVVEREGEREKEHLAHVALVQVGRSVERVTPRVIRKQPAAAAVQL